MWLRTCAAGVGAAWRGAWGAWAGAAVRAPAPAVAGTYRTMAYRHRLKGKPSRVHGPRHLPAARPFRNRVTSFGGVQANAPLSAIDTGERRRPRRRFCRKELRVPTPLERMPGSQQVHGRFVVLTCRPQAQHHTARWSRAAHNPAAVRYVAITLKKATHRRAVVRNRIRRRVRAAADAVVSVHAQPGYDYVLLAKLAAYTCAGEALRADIEGVLRKAGRWVDEPFDPTSLCVSL